MLATESFLEKKFEMWPGLLRFSASGEGALSALDLAMDTARAICDSLMGDAELLSRGSLDVLPRGAAARHALEAGRIVSAALGAQPAPPLLVALPGAVCDLVLAGMCDAGGVDAACVTLGDACSYFAGHDGLMPLGMPPVGQEFARSLDGAGYSGGIALGGAAHVFPTSGIADLVAAHSVSAAQSALLVASVSDMMVWRGAKARRGRIVDPFVAQAFSGQTLAEPVGLVPPEDIWEVLSKGARRASLLRDKRLFTACVFALKGRGRIVAPVGSGLGGDRLLRLGVSEWR